jgi:hypothetical protein
MPDNTLPSGTNALISLAERIADGYAKHAIWLRLTVDHTQQLHPEVAAFRKLEASFQESRWAKAAAGREAVAADKALTEWLAKARMIVLIVLGAKWTQAWLAAGFTHRRTNVPKRIAARLHLARQLITFFEKNPQWEYPAGEITAAGARAIYDRINAARDKMRDATIDCLTKGQARDKAERELRWRLRTVVVMLSGVLPAHDTRWLEFGLHQPRERSSSRQLGEYHARKSAALEPIPLAAEEELRRQDAAAVA